MGKKKHVDFSELELKRLEALSRQNPHLKDDFEKHNHFKQLGSSRLSPRQKILRADTRKKLSAALV